MSLNTRILALASTLTIIAAVASWLAYRELSQSIMERWGQEVAEIQVRYDSARLLQSLEREIGLARQMADSLAIQRWADTPDDPALKATAIRQMESFRNNFRDNTYFVALRKNLHYYFNNASNDFAGQQFRYQLDPTKDEDAWFFRLIDEGRDFHLNVNPDTELGVTKLWIDVLIRDNNRDVLGMVGTGLDLDAFLQDTVDVGQAGITTLFVDFNGAIQLYRDQNYIDFASIIKPEGQKNTIDLLFDAADDKQKMLGMLQMLKNQGGEDGAIASSFVTIDGRRHLAGVAYLPAIGWFEITLLDLDVLIPPSFLWPLVAVFLSALLITLVLFHALVRRWVLQPVVALEQAVKQVREGNFDLQELPKPANEIGQLSGHFEDMAATLKASTENLQEQVSQRTDELNQLARIDALTGLGNRRALDEALAAELERARRQHRHFGILWLDIDHFKTINDDHGHQTGDAILCDVAHWLKASLRPYDVAGRWGGDEFVVILSPCDTQTLTHTAQRIRVNIERQGEALGLPVSASIGGYLVNADDSLDDLLKRADQALYQAKQDGRNRVHISAQQPSATV